MKQILLVTIFWFLSIQFRGYHGGKSEKSLLKNLFDPVGLNAHNILERPVKNESETVNVRVKFDLIEILKLDEKNSQIRVSMWIAMKWKDYHFQWDMKEYNGIKTLVIPSQKIWKPDIRLYNSIDDNLMNQFPTHMVVDNTGMIMWVPPGQYSATCTIDVTYFPFDIQHCQLIFGSWTYHNKLVNITLQCANNINSNNQGNCNNFNKMNLDYYRMNNEFLILDNNISVNYLRYGDDLYTDLRLNMFLQRQPLYYTIRFLVPCIILSLMVLLVFCLPPASGEKISLGIITLISMVVLLQVVSDRLPQTSYAIPLICRYLLCAMILCSLSILSTVIVLNLHHRSANEIEVPNWIRNAINKKLARILLMKMDETTMPKDDILLHSYESSSPKKEDSTDKLFIIAEELLKISKKYSNDNLHVFIMKEWKFAARVIDRFCLIIFSFLTIISTLIFLTNQQRYIVKN